MVAALLAGFAPATTALGQDSEDRDRLFVDEIVVTAQKREERLIDVPLGLRSGTGTTSPARYGS